MEGAPKTFIASSAEGKRIADALQEHLDEVAFVKVWDQGVVGPSSYVLEDLIGLLDDFDFGIFVFTPDDLVQMRGATQAAVRDNVLFEMGLFIGRIGRDRTFMLMPRAGAEMRVASDLAGLTAVPYDPERLQTDLVAGLGTAASKITRAIREKGVRSDRRWRDELARLRAENERTRTTSLTPPDHIIYDQQIGAASFIVIHDNICNTAAEVVVSSDDNHFTARGGVSKAILAKLGPEVRAQLDQFAKREFRQGHLAVTTGGQWNRRAVIHAAVIDLDENRYPTTDSIQMVTRRALSCAAALGARTVALPILGGGFATRHIDARTAAAAVAQEVVGLMGRSDERIAGLSRVSLYVFDRAHAEPIEALLGHAIGSATSTRDSAAPSTAL